MFIHVPAATIAMGGYLLLAVLGASLLVWRHPLAALMARATAPVGATFTAVGLITGSLWGRPMWGTWWVWDARLTSFLLLFFLFLGHIALSNAYDDPDRGDRSASILARRRRDQRADHQVLGRLVEHAAPARLDHESWAARRSIRRSSIRCSG